MSQWKPTEFLGVEEDSSTLHYLLDNPKDWGQGVAGAIIDFYCFSKKLPKSFFPHEKRSWSFTNDDLILILS